MSYNEFQKMIFEGDDKIPTIEEFCKLELPKENDVYTEQRIIGKISIQQLEKEISSFPVKYIKNIKTGNVLIMGNTFIRVIKIDEFEKLSDYFYKLSTDDDLTNKNYVSNCIHSMCCKCMPSNNPYLVDSIDEYIFSNNNIKVFIPYEHTEIYSQNDFVEKHFSILDEFFNVNSTIKLQKEFVKLDYGNKFVFRVTNYNDIYFKSITLPLEFGGIFDIRNIKFKINKDDIKYSFANDIKLTSSQNLFFKSYYNISTEHNNTYKICSELINVIPMYDNKAFNLKSDTFVKNNTLFLDKLQKHNKSQYTKLMAYYDYIFDDAANEIFSFSVTLTGKGMLINNVKNYFLQCSPVYAYNINEILTVANNDCINIGDVYINKKILKAKISEFSIKLKHIKDSYHENDVMYLTYGGRHITLGATIDSIEKLLSGIYTEEKIKELQCAVVLAN